jgi:hypothetical protein
VTERIDRQTDKYKQTGRSIKETQTHKLALAVIKAAMTKKRRLQSLREKKDGTFV